MLWLEKAVFMQGAYPLNADFKITEGQVTAVIGPSGAGKSTLLGGIGGFFPQTSGRLFWKNAEITDHTPSQRPVSSLFQDNNLFPHLTIRQNIALALSPRLRPTSDVLDRVELILGRVGLTGLGERKPGALSGGQQSRAALARALLHNREIMLMDEPFSALGPGLKAEMLDLSIELARAAGRTVVMVTHDPSDAARVSDAIIGVLPSKALAPVKTEEFLRDPPESLVAYLGLRSYTSSRISSIATR